MKNNYKFNKDFTLHKNCKELNIDDGDINIHGNVYWFSRHA